MKLVFLLLLISNRLFNQPIDNYKLYYKVGDTLTVVAKSGSILRNPVSEEASKIDIIPFGAKVIVLETIREFKTFEGRHGRWLIVEYNGIKGKTFSGYLTNLKLPRFIVGKLDYSENKWLREFFKINTDSLICEGNKNYNCSDLNSHNCQRISWELYSNRTMITSVIGYEYEYLKIETYEININDIVNLIEYYLSKIEFAKEPILLREGKPNLNLTKDKSGNLLSIECFQIGLHAQQVSDKLVINLALEDL